MERNDQSLVKMLDEIEDSMLEMLEKMFGVKFEIVSNNPYKTNVKSDFEEWETGTFKEAEIFRT